MTTRESYDIVAGEYGQRIFGELEGKPIDRALLGALTEHAAGRTVLDLGCGPGHVSAWLRAAGADVLGLDLSEGMLAEARRRVPGVTFVQGDMLGALPFEDDAFGAIAAMYSLLHVPREQLSRVLAECLRVTATGGRLLCSFHLGSEDLRLTDWWGHEVDVMFHSFQVAEMRDALEEAGWRVEMEMARAPYEGREHPSRRGYLLACAP